MENSTMTTTIAMKDSKESETRSADLNVTERIGTTKNPLLINLVVSTVLKNLDVQDLKNCRLVNKIWNSESTAILKKKSVVRFRYVFQEEEEAETLEMFSRYLVEMIHFGHTNFYFSNYLDMSVENEVRNFFRCLGHQIKSISLKLQVKWPSNLELFQDVMENIPNVEDLEILLCVFDGYGLEFGSFMNNIKPLNKVRKLTLHIYFNSNLIATPQDMVEFIVKLVPKSESLVFGRNSNSSFSNKILKKYANSHDAQEVTISDITMFVKNDEDQEVIQLLSEWPISLKKLNLGLKHRLINRCSKDFQALLNRHCSTLENLKIHVQNCWDHIQIEINMPKFPKLLKLNITKDTDYHWKVGTIDFRFDSDLKDHFPLLEIERDEIDKMFAKLRSAHSDLYTSLLTKYYMN